MHDQDDSLKDIHDEDEVSIEEEEELTPASIKKLREKLKTAVNEKQQYLEGWQRDKAEFVNLRKRDEEAREQFLVYAKQQLLEDLLPTLASFEIAFSNKTLWESVSKEWRDGISSIYNNLLSTLAKNGVKPIEPSIGDDFDPKLHEAVLNTPTNDNTLDHKIATVLQKGYLLNEKVLRPAQVAVYSSES